jgi:hypothetical protein
MSLSPNVFKAREAIAVCEDWVDALCKGGFVRLLSVPRGKRSKG